MTTSEKIVMIKTMMGIEGISEDARIAAYLTAASNEIIAWRYKNSTQQVTELPSEYDMTQIFAVMAGYNQSGAEGQTSFTENGVSAAFKYTDMLSYIHANVIPIVKVI